MPISYTIGSDIVVITGTGKITDQEILDAAQKFFSDPLVKSGVPTLTDLSGSTDSVVTRKMILGVLAQRHAATSRRGAAKHAIFAPGDMEFGMSRVYGAMGESDESEVEVRVFRDLDEAKAWLGIK